MKKLLTALFSIALLIGLTGCGDPAPTFYTITYVSEFGTAPDAISVEEGTVLTAEQLPSISAEGYTFKGWFDGETQAKADEYTVTNDVTLTAEWEVAIKNYTVSFTTSIGTKPKAFTVAENTILTAEQLPAIEDPDKNHNFKGWYDDDTLAKAGEYKVTKDVVLTAEWKSIVTVTYQSEFGTIPTAIRVEEGTKLTADQLPALTADGYIFLGWFDGDQKEAKAGEYEVTTAVVLTAKWEWSLLGSWDYTVIDIDQQTCDETKIPTRITFVDDTKFEATVVYDLSALLGTEDDPLFYTIKGTYTNTNGTITLTFDETQFSPINGAMWLPTEEDSLGFTENAINLIKGFEIKIDSEKLKVKPTASSSFVDYPNGKTVDEKLIGAWEDDNSYGMRMQFNSDNTFYMGETGQTGADYGKGKYVIIDGYVLVYCTQESVDFETWTDLDDGDILSSMMTANYTFNGDKLNVGMDFNKLTAGNIKY